ncbi:hypothetical protein GCM10010440_60080 [Kitasatospora cinereorecta]
MGGVDVGHLEGDGRDGCGGCGGSGVCHDHHARGCPAAQASRILTGPGVGLAGGRPGDSVTFLVAYEDFTGRTIAHCHQLHHEDLGMMQTVHYVEP